MAFIRVPNVVQVEMVYLWDGQFVENVFHAQHAPGYDESDIANLLDVFNGWHDANLDLVQSSAVSLINLIGTDLDSQTGPRVEDSAGLPRAGTAASPSMPNNVSLVVKWTTGNRGKSFRGRTYHIGLREDVVTANRVDAGHIASLVTHYGPILTLLTAAGWTMVVASRYTNNAPRATGIATPITGFSIEPVVDSQRRRLPNRGR